MTDEQMQIVLIVFWRKKAYYEEIAVIFKRKLQYKSESEKRIQQEIALLALRLQT